MQWFKFGIAVWRLSYLLTKEDGPGMIVRDFRELTGVQHDSDGNPMEWNDWTPLHCIYCTSLWVAPFALLFPSWLITLLAGSGIAVLVDKLSSATQIRIVNNHHG